MSQSSTSRAAKRRASGLVSDTSSNALINTSSSKTLMLPPPPPKRIKRPAQVLDEDSYTDALSHIIARDFFPGLAETEAQNDYLDALKSKDLLSIQAAGERLAEVMAPHRQGRRGTGLVTSEQRRLRESLERTPIPVSARAEDENIEKSLGSEVNVDLSLAAFQAKYTSEDNESFNQLLDKQNEERQRKHAWLWNDNQLPSARQITYRRRQDFIEAKRAEQEDEDGKKLLVIEKPDVRKAMPEAWISRPNNNLIFEPDSIEDSMPSEQQNAERESRAGPKAVMYANTRLPIASEITNATNVPESPSLSAVNEAIAGRPRFTPSELGDKRGDETPRVNGYAFVDSEPSSEPEARAGPTTDWSRLPLGSGDAAPNPFNIRARSNREELHYRMVDKVAKSKRHQKAVAPTTTTLPSSMGSARSVKDGLTPAARRLLGNVGDSTPRGSVWEGSTTPKAKNSLAVNRAPKAKTPRKSE